MSFPLPIPQSPAPIFKASSALKKYSGAKLETLQP